MATRNLGQLERSATFAGQVLAAARRAGSSIDEAAALLGLGDIAHDQGRYDDAVTLFEQAQAIARRHTHTGIECIALTTLARVAYRQGRYDQAVARYEASRAVAGPESGMGAIIAWELGLVQLATGEVAAAAASFRTCIAASATDDVFLLYGVDGLAAVALHTGSPSKAVRLWAAANELRTRGGIERDALFAPELAQWLADARSLLGADSFEANWRQGGQLTRAQLLAEALEG
jgi:tetratricopeptide (TPR) repeat protein